MFSGAVVETVFIELAKQLARRKVGIAFQTRIGLERYLAEGVLVHFPLAGPVFSDLGLYVRAGRYLGVTADAVVQLLASEIADHERAEF